MAELYAASNCHAADRSKTASVSYTCASNRARSCSSRPCERQTRRPTKTPGPPPARPPARQRGTSPYGHHRPNIRSCQSEADPPSLWPARGDRIAIEHPDDLVAASERAAFHQAFARVPCDAETTDELSDAMRLFTGRSTTKPGNVTVGQAGHPERSCTVAAATLDCGRARRVLLTSRHAGGT